MSFVLSLTNSLRVSLEGRSVVPERKTLRSLSYQMLPQFVFDTYPTFVEFVEVFLDFLEKRYSPDGVPNPGPYHILKNLIDTSDIDRTELEFVYYVKNTLGRNLPAVTRHDLRSFLKSIRNFYLAKGTEKSIQFFFRSVFGTYSRIYLPKKDLIRASSNTWYRPYRTQLQFLGGAVLSDIELGELFDASVFGQTSGVTAWLGEVIAPGYVEILSSSGEFSAGETVTVVKTNGTSIDLWIPLGGIGYSTGSFLTDDGMPSSTKRLQDSNYWQEFSYEIVSSNQISDIINPMVMNTHPAGFKIFAKVENETPEVIDDGEEIGVLSLLNIIMSNEIAVDDNIDVVFVPTNLSFVTYVQSYVDNGEMLDGDLGFLYEDSTAFDLFRLQDLQADEPSQSILAFFGGRKVPCRFAKDQGAYIGFSEALIEDIGELPIENSTEANVRILNRKTLPNEVLIPTEAQAQTSFTLYGQNDIGSGWSNSAVTGKCCLVFENGLLVPAITMSSALVGGKYVAALTGMSMEIDPVFELVYFSERDLAKGTHTFTRVLASGETIVNFLPSHANTPNALVFLNGKFLVPDREFKIDAGKLVLRVPSVTLGDFVYVVLLRQSADASVILEPLLGTFERYELSYPYDNPVEIVPTKLVSNLMEAFQWNSFSKSNWYPDELSAELGVPLEGLFVSSDFMLGPGEKELVTKLSANGTEINKGPYLNMADFVPADGDPFTVNIWFNLSDVSGIKPLIAIGEMDTGNLFVDSTLNVRIVRVGSEERLYVRAGNGVSLYSTYLVIEPLVWNMLTVRYNGTNLIVQVNNGAKTTVSAPGILSPASTSEAFSIGKDDGNYFIGGVAYFGMWNMVLRDHEITEMYNSGLALERPVLYI